MSSPRASRDRPGARRRRSTAARFDAGEAALSPAPREVELDDPALADSERPLAPRGRRASKLIARHFRSERIRPELVLCSPARRARETLERIAGALGDDAEIRIDSELYGASSSDLLARIRALPEGIGSAMLIGHNPGIQDLAVSLAGEGPG